MDKEQRKDPITRDIKSVVSTSRDTVTNVDQQLRELNALYPGQRHLPWAEQDKAFRSQRDSLLTKKRESVININDARRSLRGRLRIV